MALRPPHGNIGTREIFRDLQDWKKKLAINLSEPSSLDPFRSSVGNGSEELITLNFELHTQLHWLLSPECFFSEWLKQIWLYGMPAVVRLFSSFDELAYQSRDELLGESFAKVVDHMKVWRLRITSLKSEGPPLRESSLCVLTVHRSSDEQPSATRRRSSAKCCNAPLQPRHLRPLEVGNHLE